MADAPSSRCRVECPHGARDVAAAVTVRAPVGDTCVVAVKPCERAAADVAVGAPVSVLALPQAVLGACLSFLSVQSLAAAEVASSSLRDAARGGGAWDAVARVDLVAQLAAPLPPGGGGGARDRRSGPWVGRGVTVVPRPGSCFARDLILAVRRRRAEDAVAAAAGAALEAAWRGALPRRVVRASVQRASNFGLGVVVPAWLLVSWLVLLSAKLDGIHGVSSWYSVFGVLAAAAVAPLADGAAMLLCMCAHVGRRGDATSAFRYTRCGGVWRLLVSTHGSRARRLWAAAHCTAVLSLLAAQALLVGARLQVRAWRYAFAHFSHFRMRAHVDMHSRMQ